VANVSIASGGFSSRLRTAAGVLIGRINAPDATSVEAE
jgi:D-alanyl-D-alanine carboxypeptidase (penicillin-binding protein 5/6)